MKRIAILTALAIAGTSVSAQDAGMSFFITSENPGSGADFRGLEGADAHCTALAEAAGVAGKTWKAYLSTSEVDARDRIGAGPWVNAEGVEVAANVDALHGDNNIGKETGLDEMGNMVNGRGDDPNRHDILTGSNADGTFAGQDCGAWTSSGEGSAMVGHHDRMGLDETPPSLSWNASHASRGCSLDALKSTGGGGLIYCFAAE
jgi:hypothetical protein